MPLSSRNVLLESEAGTIPKNFFYYVYLQKNLVLHSQCNSQNWCFAKIFHRKSCVHLYYKHFRYRVLCHIPPRQTGEHLVF